MRALLTVEDDNGSGAFKRLGTEGRLILKSTRRATVIRNAARLQRSWQGRAVQVEEWNGDTIYPDPDRVWTYHCACDLDRPCAFHGGGDL